MRTTGLRWKLAAASCLLLSSICAADEQNAPAGALAQAVPATPAAPVAQVASISPAPEMTSAEAKKTDTGDTAWILISAALVMLMTPGLAFFYGGLVRRKNILSMLMQCFMVLCLISLEWILAGYSLSFGPDTGRGLIGDLSWAGLKNMPAVSDYAPTVPHSAFVIFQMMFAVITPGLIIGAFAERMRFSAFCVFSVLWALLVYNPVCHWMWGAKGFMGTQGGWGAIDFAGGTVVHINAGMAALAAAMIFGRRLGFPNKTATPHNLPVAALGAAMLWFGWFGFNAGSALHANGLACSAFLATHTAGAAGGLMWCVLDWLKHGKPTTLGMITGAVAGLAAVTPGAGFVDAMGALWIGIISGVICWYAVTYLKNKLGYDDSLDAFGVHGVGGIWGTIAAGIWATRAVNPDGPNGLLAGNSSQLFVQMQATVVTAVYSFIVSLVLLKLVDIVLRLRVTEHDERVGLDLSQHKETGYTVID